MADAARLLLVLLGNADGALAALAETNAALEETGAAATKSNGLLDGFANGIKTLAVGTVAVGAVIAAVSTKFAADFQQGTTRLITNAGETREAVDNIISPALLRLAVTTGYSTSQLIEGFRQVSSAGFKAANGGIDVLTVAAEGARAENADLGTVLNVVTSILNAYNLKASDSTMVVNTLTAAMQSGKLTLQDLSSSLGTVIPAAANAHVSIQEITSAMAVMANEGIKPANAATYLRFTLQNLSEPIPKAQKALESIGLQADSLKNTLNERGLGAAIEQLETAVAKKFPASAQIMREEFAKVQAGTESLDDAVGKLSSGSFQGSEAIAAITGGIRGMQGILALGGAHLSIFNQNTQAMTDKVKVAGREIIGWNEIQKNLNFQLSRAQEALEYVAIVTGQHLIPVVTQGAKLLADSLIPAFDRVTGLLYRIGTASFDTFQKLNHMGVLLPIVAGLVTGFAAWRASIVALAAAEIIVKMIGWLTAAVQILAEVRTATELWTAAQVILDGALIANPIGIIVFAVAALVAAIAAVIVQNKALRDELLRVWNSYRQAVGGVIEFIREHQNLLVILGVLSGPIGWLGIALGWVVTHWHQVTQALQRASTWFNNTVGAITGISHALDVYRSYLWAAYDRSTALARALESMGIPFAQARLLVQMAHDALNAFHGAADRVRSMLSNVHSWLGRLNMVLDVYRGWLWSGYDRTTALAQALGTLGIPVQATMNFLRGLEQVWKSVSDAFAKAGKELAPTFAQLGGVLRDAWHSLVQALEEARPLLFQLISALLPYWPLFEQIAGVIKSAVVVALQTFAAVLGIIAVVVGALLAGAFSGLVKFLVVAIPAAVGIVVGLIRVLVGIFVLFADIYEGKWGKLGSDVSNIVSGFVEFIMNLFNLLVTAPIALLQGFVQGVVGFFQWLYDQVVGHSIIPDLVNGVINWILQLDARVIAVIEFLVASFIGLVLNLRNQVLAAADNLTGGFVSKLLDMAGNARNAVQGVADRVMEVLNGLPSKVYSIGTSIATGIASGITDSIQHVEQAAGNLVSDAINAAKRAAGNPQSPAPATIPLGKSLAEGVQSGIDSGSKAAQSSMTGLIQGTLNQATGALRGATTQIAAAMSASSVNVQQNLVAAAASGRYGASPITVNVTNPAPQPYQIARELAWALRRAR